MTSLAMPMCGMCTHLHRDETGKGLIPWRCDAFPEGIPADILVSQFDHRVAHDGDHGIRFEPRPEKGARALAYVDALFPPERKRRLQQARDAQQSGERTP
jgi:hypothetical protein